MHDDSATGGDPEPGGRSLQQMNRVRQACPLGPLQKGAVVWAERRIDHATIGDSNRIHRRLEDAVELRTIPIGSTDVGRAEWCVPSQSIQGCLEDHSVLPLPEQ